MFSDILFLPEIIAPNSSLIYEKYVRPIVLYGKPFLVMRQTQAWEESVQNLYHHIVNVCLDEEDLTELRIQAGVSELWTRLFHYLYREESEQQENKNILAQARLRKMMRLFGIIFMKKSRWMISRLLRISARAPRCVVFARGCRHLRSVI